MKEAVEFEVNSEMTEKSLVFVEGILENMEISMKIQHVFLVAVDELVSNILNHSNATEMTLVLEKEDDKLVLTIIDNSFAFNPVEAQGNENEQGDVIDRPIGGLGIHMVKKMMDHLEYKYEGEKNIFRMEKNLT
jgi:serine/threonine-protein kinase RsbW